MKNFPAPILAVTILTACNGASTSSNAVPRGVADVTSPTSVRQAAQIASAPTQLLYVGNAGNNSITVYGYKASGNIAPLRTISGPQTEIDSPGQLSQDVDGNLYVANGRQGARSAHPAVLVFAHGANGNVAPIRTIAGPLTGLHNVGALAVDQTTGNVFVVNLPDGLGATGTLLRFSSNATGNAAPSLRSAHTLPPALQLTFNSTNENLIIGHYIYAPEGATAGIRTVAKQFPNHGVPKDLYEISWFPGYGVVDDRTTKTYFASSDGIYRLAEDTVGIGPNNPSEKETFKPKPLSVITSDTCGGQLALAQGLEPDIYVTHSAAVAPWPICPSDAVYVYAHDANGKANPLRILTGAATLLNGPSGIYVGI